MESKKIIVIFGQPAKDAIREASKYIDEMGYPETAENFSEKLYDFGDSLAFFPDKYPLCRFQKFAKKNLRCAVFEKTYIFVYKVVKNELIIYNVIHGKALK